MTKIVIAALVFSSLASCGPAGKQVAVDVAACAAGQVPGAVADVLPRVLIAIQGGDAGWQTEIASLEARGVNFAICAIEAAVADLTKAHGVLSQAALAARQLGVQRGHEYLAKHGISMRATP